MSTDTLLAPITVKDVFLNPGEFYFGSSSSRIRTLLGSCVSIILWHPVLKIGGMCHFLLPTRGDRRQGIELDGKYGDEAIQLFLKEISKKGSKPKDYQVKLFGGANMFQKKSGNRFVSKSEEEVFKREGSAIGHKNIQYAISALENAGFSIQGKDIGGFSHRRIFFTIWDGEVWVESTDNEA